MNKTKLVKAIQLVTGVIAMLFIINCSSNDDSGNATPVAKIITTGSFTNYGEVDVLSHSASQSFEVEGVSLVGNIAIATSVNFEVSVDDVSFSSEATIDKASGNSGNTIIYVRFSPTANAVGITAGTITLESSQAATKTLSLIGTGVSIAPIINVNGVVNNFGDVMVSENSETQNITINGDHLVSNIMITASTDFNVSLDNITFTSSVQIPAASANNDATVYVRFSPITLGAATGTLTLANADTTDTVIALEGNGAPVRHNYVAFNEQALGYGGGFNQSEAQTFTLHSDLTNIAQIKMYVQIDCPSSGCDDWDRFANIKVKDQITGDWYEIGRYITPYWTGTQQLDRGLEFDVTDFKSLLTGATELRIYIENWTSKADLITVDFDYIEGTPDYPYYAVSEVLGYHVNSIDGVPYGVAHSFDLDKQVVIPANAESTHLRTVISGWGHATPNDAGGRPCAEWCYRTHDIKIDGSNTFSHYLGPLGCAANPVNNQNPGNWTQDRAGWCPGMAVPTRIDDLGASMGGSIFTFEYDFEDWVNDGANGSAYYATSTYVVVKSNSVITAPVIID
ncbi:peptide-N-glycosidase F-related protein [Lacinutrix sp. Bg11-31]|uniref:peptide-N-glycosidase F-related protein n=1 Tax=Lacinutrix sp. Bg11-31 TaxID=2057808 RepID=UPI0018E1DC2F|nr:peptide-N-glycosidase F-related protein [Lacinutrix sp. Bg11-31]